MPPIQHFRVREKLLRIMKMVGATERLFTTEKVLSYLGKYIEQRKLHDSQNMRIVRCKGDLLEDIFGVQEFTIGNLKDIWQFVFPHLIPATNKEIHEHDEKMKNRQESLQNSQHDAPSGKNDFQWMSQLPWWYFVEKNSKGAEENPDIATASGSIVATSTAYVVDTEYESESTVSTKPVDNEDRFSLEYEPDSESEDSDATEPFYSDEDEPFMPAPLPRITDCDDTTTTDTTDVSMDFDIPLEDHWKCTECTTVNPPTVGYCQRCWKLRKGWLPDTELPSPILTKSFTLPAGEFSETFLPSVSRSYTQPNPITAGYDVADGKSNSGGSCSQPNRENSNSSNFNELPFNNSNKRKLDDSQDELNSPPLSKLKITTASNLPNSLLPSSTDHGASTSKDLDINTVFKKANSVSPNLTSSDSSTLRENQSSSTSNSHPQYSISVPGLCNICHNNPNDATIVHGNLGHQYCCYRCAKKLKKRGKTCPVCRQPIAFVVKNYICQM
uniref:E3 ubiquitin-protein ligase Mdm2-like isoform X2 n=1 Tax=Styela clava TaxID=7725 RepID=UPI001939B6BA|nr:E3 ubiquitin-protein ligase Mdm2-like isoform X2 [Styela clava]